MIKKLNSQTKIRFLSESDCEDLYNWRNDKVTRKYSINKNIINKKKHLSWYSSFIAHNRKNTYILLKNKTKIGLCSIREGDKNFKKKYFVKSYLINPKFRNQGFGSIVLHKSIKKFLQKKKQNIYAIVHINNNPSLITFLKNDFYFDKVINKNFILVKQKNL